jgi:hypothetical protein
MKLLKAKPFDRMTTEPPPPTWGQRKGKGQRVKGKENYSLLFTLYSFEGEGIDTEIEK